MDVWTNQQSQDQLVMISSEDSTQQMLPMSRGSPVGIKTESLERSPFPPSSPQTQLHEHIIHGSRVVPHQTHHQHSSATSVGHHHDSIVAQAAEMLYSANGGGGGGPSYAGHSAGPSRYPSTEDVVMSTDAGSSHRHGNNDYHPNLARRISSYDSCSSPDSPDRHFCSSTTQSNGDLNNSIAEENGKDEVDSPKRVCLVCGDTASGFHYGVASCEACKAFFKRTIQGNIEYTCPASNDCEINKRRRKACQACRFQKCIRMGMLKEGVRLDRVRGGRQKYRRSSEMPYPMNHSSLPQRKQSLEDNKILVALMGNEPELPTAITPDSLLVHAEIRTISILSDLYDKEIISTIGWAKQVPGFTDLTLNDQMRLLQSTWTEVLTLSLAFRSIATPGRLIFAADFSLDERQARDAGVYELYQPCCQVMERFEQVGLLKEEYCLLKALILANADTRIDDLGSLKKLRETVIAALFDCSTVLRSTNAISHVNMLLMCLPILRQADLAIKKFWLSVRRDGKVGMNKLFVEMLEAYFR